MKEVTRRLMSLGRIAECGNYVLHRKEKRGKVSIVFYDAGTGELLWEHDIDSKTDLYYQNNINSRFGICLAEVSGDQTFPEKPVGQIISQFSLWETTGKKYGYQSYRTSEKWYDKFANFGHGMGKDIFVPTKNDQIQRAIRVSKTSGGILDICVEEIRVGDILPIRRYTTNMASDTEVAWCLDDEKLYLVERQTSYMGTTVYVAYRIAQESHGEWDIYKGAHVVDSAKELSRVISTLGPNKNSRLGWFSKVEFISK